MFVVLLCRKHANLLTLRSRYTSMYIPSDFFHATLSWSDAFPIHRPFRLGQACQFHIMSKEVEAPNRKQLESLLDPHDADHTFSAKVLTANGVWGHYVDFVFCKVHFIH